MSGRCNFTLEDGTKCGKSSTYVFDISPKPGTGVRTGMVIVACKEHRAKAETAANEFRTGKRRILPSG